MKLFFALLLVFTCSRLLGQQFYPYPQPKPTNGFTPTNLVIRLSAPIAPSTYQNDNPAVWDTDIGGGLQSRTNETDRFNARWLRYGAIILDQSDRTYYAVDVLPGTTNLQAYKPLFTMDGFTNITDTSIYKNDGDLLGDREVDLGNFTLTFQGAGGLRSYASTVDFQSPSWIKLASSSMELLGATDFRLRTPGVWTQTVTNGWFLKLLNRDTGQVEFAPAPTGTNDGGSIIDTSIYKADGIIEGSGTRTVHQNTNPLRFNGGATGTFTVDNQASVTLAGGTTSIHGTNSILLKTPEVLTASAAVGDVLVLTNVNGKAEFAPLIFPPPVNVYNTDGQMDDPVRVVDVNGGELVFNNAAAYRIGGFGDVSEYTYSAPTGFYSVDVGNGVLELKTAFVNNGIAKAGHVLTYSGGLSGVEFMPVPSTNIYSHNGTLAGDRIVTGASKDLRFNGVDEYSINANVFDAIVSTRLGLKTPGIASVNNGDVLTLQDKTTGRVEYGPPPNLYNLDGTLQSNRKVDGAGRTLSFTNNATLGLQAQTNTLIGNSELNLVTPNVVGGTVGTNGQVLTLMDNTSGKVEFKPLPPPPTDISVFTHDGTNTANRSITIPSNMYMRTIGDGTLILNSAFNNLSAKSNNIVSTDRTLITATTNLQIRGPRIMQGINPPSAGNVLTLLDPSNGQVEYHPPNNLGNSNQMLTTTRYVEGNNAAHSFVFRGINIHQTDANFVLLRGTNEIRLTTPGIFGGTKSAGMFLKLVNAGSGTAEWDAVPTAAAVNTIYTQNDTITTDRTVNQGGKFLVFNAASTSFVVTNAGHAKILATTNWITATNKFLLTTPAVYWDGAAAHAGKFLKLNADGTSEFSTIPPTGTDATIYNTSGTLIGDRIVDGGAFDLTFHNIDALTNAALTQVINGLSLLQIKTPNFSSSPGSLAVGQALLLQDATTGRVEYQNIPTNNIYNRDGNVTGPRLVNLNAQSLTFSGSAGGGNFSVIDTSATDFTSKVSANLSSATTRIAGTNALKIVTPLATANKATPGHFLKLTANDGSAEWDAVPASRNLYNWSDSITDPVRSVGLANNTLNFNGNGTVNFNMGGGIFTVSGGANSTIAGNSLLALRGPTLLRIETQRVASTSKPDAGEVLTLMDQTGRVEYQPSGNIYNKDGTLSTDRMVSGGGKSLTFGGGLNNFVVDAFTVDLAAHTALKLQTPSTFNGSAKDNWVMTYNSTDGTADWEAIPSIPTLYTQNGTLSGPDATRTVTMGGKNLQFNGNGGNFSYAGASGNFSVSGTTSSTISGTGIITLETGSSGNIRLRTPLVVGGTPPAIGSVLKLKDSSGAAEWGAVTTTGSVPTIYTEDSFIDDAVRVVNGAGHTLTFNNNLAFNALASSTRIQGTSLTMESASTGELRLKTPKVMQSTAVTNSVLVLKDATTGRVEFESAPPGSGGGIVYYGQGLDLSGVVPGPAGAFHFYVGDVLPWYESGLQYPFGTILSIRVTTSGVSTSWTNSTQQVWVKMGNGPDKQVYAPDGSKLAPGDIRHGSVMHLVYMDKIGATALQGWCMINTGWKSELKPTILATAHDPSSVATIGAVDTFLELAGAPLSFKKISTLGFASIGDGKHGDYYLAPIDLTAAPGTWIQSSVDPNKMWKQLIPR